MNSFTRFVGYSALLLLAFLAVTLAAQQWLHRETQRLGAEAVAAKRAQLAAARLALPRPAAEWTDAEARLVGAMVGGAVTVLPKSGRAAELPSPFAFEEDAGAAVVRVQLAPPPFTRLAALHQRVVVGLALLAAFLLGLWCMLVALAWRRPAHEAVSRSPWAFARAEISGLAHLARASVAQGAELDRERAVRQRAEEDARLGAEQLARSLAGKIRLGHDLHDGIIQSLYAVGLTLESVRALARTDAAEADRRLEKCVQSLNGTIQDVRAYITGLTSEHLRRDGFAHALDALFAELQAGRAVEFERRIDEDATARLSDEQGNEALLIAREAVSNSLRHGRATAVTVRLHQGDGEVCLLVQDNGGGFDPARRTASGHGLGNMPARARRLRAAVRIDSRPGEGTRVVLTLPLPNAGRTCPWIIMPRGYSSGASTSIWPRS